jgi:hypothetical protein
MEGIKIDGKSALLGGAAGLVAGGLLGYILARRAFNAKLDSEIAAVKHHYYLRAASARSSSDAVERAVPTLADWLGQPGVCVGYLDPRDDDKEYISWIHPEDLVVRQTQVPDRDVSSPGVEYVDSNGLERDFYGNTVDHAQAIKASEERLMADLELPPSAADVSGDVLWPPANRDRSKPYVISDAEFAEGCTDDGCVHQCLSIRWYDEDEVLVDDRDQPIPDVRRTTGPISKASFGGVAGEPYIMYVRNEKLQVDFEIAFDERAYTEAVLNYGTANPRKRL